MTIPLEAPSHIPQDCGHEEAFRDSDTAHRVASLALDAGPGPSRSDHPIDAKPVENTHIWDDAWRDSSTETPTGHDYQLRYDSGTSQVWHSLLIHPKDLWTSSASLDNKYAGTWNDVHQPEVPEPNNAERPDKGTSDQTNHTPIPMMHGDHDPTSPGQADLRIHHKSKLSQPNEKPSKSQTGETWEDRKQLDISRTPPRQLENTLQIFDNVSKKQLSQSECDLIEPTAEQHSVTGTKEEPDGHSIQCENSSASTSLERNNNESSSKPISVEIKRTKGKKSLEDDESIIATKPASSASSKRKKKKGSYFNTGKKTATKGSKVIPTLSEEEKRAQQLAWKAKKKWDVQDISQDRKNANPYIGETSHRVDSSKPIPVDTNHEELSWVAQKEPLPNPRIESKLEGKATGEVSQAPLENTDQEETFSSLGEPLAQHSNTEEKVKLNNSKHIGLQDKQPKLLAINFSNPGWDSPDMIPSSEEKHILDLIKNRQITENLKLITKAEIRSDVNYDAQAEIMKSEFQKLKTSQRLDNTSKSPISMAMLSSLDIEPQFTKKIQQVYEDMMFTPEKQGFKTTRLSDYSKSTVEKFYEIWGWEAVISWEKNRLDIGLMTQLALLLNLDHKTSHFGISPMYHQGTDLYERFLIMHIEKKKFNKIVKSIYNIIGKHEGARRLEAFCRYLRDHTTARNYALKRSTWFRGGLKEIHQVAYLELQLGLSDLPESQTQVNPWPIPFGTKKEEEHLKEFLSKICGRTDAEKKLELREYLKKLPYPSNWWLNIGLESAIKRFGIDVLKIMKIGNALQFGSKDFVGDALIKNRVPIEDAFTTILDIMTEPSSLPWIESAERAWLYNFCGRFYQDRLQQLSHLAVSRKLTKQIGKTNTTGWALVWCDLGLKISEVPASIPSTSPLQIQQKIKEYENLSGYEKLAIAIWYKSLSAKPFSSLGESKDIRVLSPLEENKSLPLVMIADNTKTNKGKNLQYPVNLKVVWKFLRDWIRYSWSIS
ncbi:hypothetical protein MJO28_013980 [Puccinia striiformis f. sp. tritici]|uniref:Uncharacterized protein n=1 Tax=Puccinia striiformis f. sp. tritici TaxID=168172 RepID=A0ACC0DXY5_9BASI|nr:hypothetical protein MJO28_013980 [Puccinia striiformis f. sp. tritici]